MPLISSDPKCDFPERCYHLSEHEERNSTIPPTCEIPNFFLQYRIHSFSCQQLTGSVGCLITHYLSSHEHSCTSNQNHPPRDSPRKTSLNIAVKSSSSSSTLTTTARALFGHPSSSWTAGLVSSTWLRTCSHPHNSLLAATNHIKVDTPGAGKLIHRNPISSDSDETPSNLANLPVGTPSSYLALFEYFAISFRLNKRQIGRAHV